MKSAYSAMTRLDENPPEIISGLRALECPIAPRGLFSRSGRNAD